MDTDCLSLARYIALSARRFASGLFLFTVAVLSWLAPTSASAGNACVSDISCRACNVTGRAYVKVGGIYCTVCMMFCHPPLGAQETEADLPRRQPLASENAVGRIQLKLSVSNELIMEIADVNPDVAHVLSILRFRSMQKDDMLTARGQGGSSFMASKRFVAQALSALADGSDADTSLASPSASYRGIESDLSRVTWALSNLSMSVPVLVMTHRIVGEDGSEVGKLYPDIVIGLTGEAQSQSAVFSANVANWSIR